MPIRRSGRGQQARGFYKMAPTDSWCAWTGPTSGRAEEDQKESVREPDRGRGVSGDARRAGEASYQPALRRLRRAMGCDPP